MNEPVFPLTKLASAFEQLLREGELNRRFGHHLAHVAPEGWLALELALLVNDRFEDVGLDGWSAVLERGRVDVTLIPPSVAASSNLPETAIYLELKLCGTDWWGTVWPAVQRDLEGIADQAASRKPKATFAVCVVTDARSRMVAVQREATKLRYAEFLSRIPDTTGPFEPIPGGPVFHVAWSSNWFEVRWPRPVFGKWPDGFAAGVRILWLCKPINRQQ